MTELTGKVGFASPANGDRFCQRRAAAIELAATVALAVCLVVAATAVSIGMARAQALGTVAHGDQAPLAIAVFFFALVGIGGLGALAGRRRQLAREGSRTFFFRQT
ncbi:MAG: hypothetical protein WBF58_21115 [Xanthobacteraceae bacterium]